MKPPLETVVRTYQNRLYAAAFSACKNPQDAEDAVQDAFLQYWFLHREFESEEHVRAWLLRVAINRAKNRARSFFRRNVVPLEDYMEQLSFEAEEDSGLFQAVMALPAKYRLPLYLYYYEGCTVAEVGELLGLKPSTVQTRLARAREKLKAQLKEE